MILVNALENLFKALYNAVYPYCMEDAAFANAFTLCMLVVGFAVCLYVSFKAIPDALNSIIGYIVAERERKKRLAAVMERIRKRREEDAKKIIVYQPKSRKKDIKIAM